MIIGNGLLANSLQNFLNEKDIILFASGVSNSSETGLQNYSREEELLLKTINGRKENEILTYFSTFSVFDGSLQNTHYVRHKLNLEKILRDAENTLVIRLPIVMSYSKNPHTLINYFMNCIKRKQSFNVFTNAYRYYISADEIKTIITPGLVRAQLAAGCINVGFPESLPVLSSVKIISEITGLTASFSEINKGEKYSVNDIIYYPEFNEDRNISALTHFRNNFIKFYT